MKNATLAVAGFALLMLAGGAIADERSDYYQRAATRDMEHFRVLDRGGNGALTRSDVAGDVDFSPRFDDMDINRDGIVTREEMQRYILQHYGVTTAPAAK